MRHRNRLSKLSRPADQRKAMLRSMTTSLFMHDQIMTTLTRAKVLRQLSDKVVTLAKRGDLHAIRQVARLIYNQPTGQTITDPKTGKEVPETVLRRIFNTVGPRAKARTSGYTRVLQAPPRRGDGTKMAVIELVD